MMITANIQTQKNKVYILRDQLIGESFEADLDILIKTQWGISMMFDDWRSTIDK
jgi:hypothetical protein